MSIVHLDTSGMIHDFQLIAEILSFETKKGGAISDPASNCRFRQSRLFLSLLIYLRSLKLLVLFVLLLQYLLPRILSKPSQSWSIPSLLMSQASGLILGS
jgi:hypothetical protein